MIRAVIFDMDGLLIDSEPFWREALKRTFPKAGIELTEDMCRQTMGLRVNEVIAYWHNVKPWHDLSFQEMEDEIIDTVGSLVIEKGIALEGTDYILTFFKQKKLRIGLATSSASRLIRVVLTKLNLENYFDIVHSAEHEPFGKPHPAVFLSTALKLNTPPPQCLTFEDSLNGLIAAQTAGMKTVIVPDRTSRENAGFDSAHLKLNSLSEFTEKHFEFLNQLP